MTKTVKIAVFLLLLHGGNNNGCFKYIFVANAIVAN